MIEEKSLHEKNKLIQEMLCSGDEIKNFYRFVAQNPHIPLHDACQIVIEKPNAGVCYTFDEWSAMGRRINKGKKGIKFITENKEADYVFDAVDTHGDTRYLRQIYPLKRLLEGLDVLNGTELSKSSRRDYQKILSGVAIYLNTNDSFTDDEEKNRLLAEGVAYSLYCRTGFPKDNGIRLKGYPYNLTENASLFSQINAVSIALSEEIEEAYLNKVQEIQVIDDTEEETISDEQFIEEQRVIVKTNSAIHSVYQGYVALCQRSEDGREKIYLGKRENYDDRGNYDNTDNSLIFVSNNPKMFSFLSGSEYVISQQEMLEKGFFTEQDYKEYYEICQKFDNELVKIREVKFNKAINNNESGEEFRYPLEEKKQQGTLLYQKYMNIQEKYPNAVVVMRVGDFYEVMGEKAVNVANALDLTLTSRDCGLEERVPMCGYPYHIAEKYLDKILDISSVVLLENDRESQYLLSHNEILIQRAEEMAEQVSDEKEIEEEPQLTELTEEESNELDNVFNNSNEQLDEENEELEEPEQDFSNEEEEDFDYEDDDEEQEEVVKPKKTGKGIKQRPKKEKPQPSLFDIIEGKLDEQSPEDALIERELKLGSGFADGKFRIVKRYEENPTEQEFARFLSHEYGVGGHSGPDCDSSMHDGKGIRLANYNKDVRVSLKWNEVAIKIADLIDSDNYLTEQEKVEYQRYLDKQIPNFREEESNEQSLDEEEDVDWENLIESGGLKPVSFEQKENTDLNTIGFDQSELGGVKQRYKANVEAIKLVKKLYREDRELTDSEKNTLAKYVGWGGIAQAFDENNEKWSTEYAELKSLLTTDEYETAKGSVLNAHFTSKEVIDGIYKALQKFGVKGNNKILEPALGTGNFFGFMPKEISENAKLYGVELDSITGKIASKLYPQAKIQIKGFEETNYPDNHFDLMVSNVPFGNYSVYDSAYSKQNFQIHDYFIAKGIDKIKPKGLMAVITSKGTMDKLTPTVRKYIADRAELVGAIRLPNTAFKQTANTQVVADILFFQKREEPIDSNTNNTEWLKTSKDEQGFEMNNYFISHPEMICGTLAEERGLYGLIDLTVKPDERTLSEAISDAVEHLPQDIYSNPEQVEEEIESDKVEADFEVKPLCYKAENGKLYIRVGDEMVKQDVPQSPKDAYDRISGMIELRKSLRHILKIQLDGCNDVDLKTEQYNLNKKYDAFVKKYGYLNSQTNTKLFKEDADSALLFAVENISEDKKSATKGDIFTKRTIRPYTQIQSTDDCFEALQISRNEKGSVDIAFIEELTKKDYDTVLQELGNAVFRNPMRVNPDDKYSGFEMQEEYLSGEVVRKLREAKRFVSDGKTEFNKNVEALEQVQPKPLTASEISVKLGVSWIDTDLYRQCLIEMIGLPYWATDGLEVSYNKHDGSYRVDKTYYATSTKQLEVTQVWGTNRANAYRLFDDLLNQKDTKIFDTVEEDGREKRVLNNAETIAAREKKNKIQEFFKKWIFEDPDRRYALEEKYNAIFNQIVLPTYDGSYLKFPEMSPTIEPRPHQKNAIHRIVSTGQNTLLHHVVGSGKTLTMIASGMKLRQYGLAKKPMFVVPNHLVNQWANEFRKYYPNANVLITQKDDLDKDRRKQFVSRVAMGDWDGIIIAQSTFAKINISSERQIAKIREEIDRIQETIESQWIERNHPQGTIKGLERVKKSREAQLKKLLDDSKKDNVLKFEDLGVDYLFVDEADAYKNLFLFTKMNNVAGISTTASQRASDLQLKIEYINELHGGDKGVVFGTGTPISNSMTEMYTMQTYLQKGTLQKLGITYFDLWAADFGEAITSLELAPSGQGYRSKTRFAKFTNIPELLTLYRSFADVQTSDMVKLDVPEAEKKVITIKPSENVIALTDEIAKRAERIYDGGVDPHIDNMLKVTSDGKKLALDPRCYDSGLQDEENSKLTECANSVFEVYQNSQEVLGTQLVFCDLSTPKKAFSDYVYGVDFDAYNDLKYKLVEMGIPENEIAFIHDANSDLQKQALFNKVNEGTVRVLIGSTEKCGAGTNVQKRLIALHHLDAPYRPRDFIQRNGRGIRQGNMNDKVQIFTYVTERTFDSYSYQILENKQRFISQIDRGDLTVREAEDIDEATLTYAEIKAITSANPKIKRKMELDNELQQLRTLEGHYKKNLYDLQDKIRKVYPEQIRQQELYIERLKKDLETTQALYNPDSFSISVKGRTYTDRKEGSQALSDALAENKTNVVVAEYCGLKISLDPVVLMTAERTVTIQGEGKYNEYITTMAYATMNRIENVVKDLPKKLERAESKLESIKNNLETAKEEVKQPFEYTERIANVISELSEINAELDLNKKEEIVIDDENEETGDTNCMALPEREEIITNKKYKAKMTDSIAKLYESEQEKSPDSFVFVFSKDNHYVVGEKAESLANEYGLELKTGKINDKESKWVSLNNDEFNVMARQLTDKNITVKVITQNKKEEDNFIETEDLMETIKVDVLPDYSITQDYMHVYGYDWDGMLPISSQRAYTLYSMGLDIFRLDKDNNEHKITKAEQLKDEKSLFGIEKDVWNTFIHHKDTYAFLEARKVLCDSLNTFLTKDCNYFDAAYIDLIVDYNYIEKGELKEYLEKNGSADREKVKAYLSILLPETKELFVNFPLSYYGWTLSDVEKGLVDNVEDEEYKEYLKGCLDNEYKSEVDKVIEEMDLMETEEMLNADKINYKEEVIKRVQDEFEKFKEEMGKVEPSKIFDFAYTIQVRQMIEALIESGMFPNKVYENLYNYKGNLLDKLSDNYTDRDLYNEPVDEAYRQSILDVANYKEEENQTQIIEENNEELDNKYEELGLSEEAKAVIERVNKEFEEYKVYMNSKSKNDILYNSYETYIKSELKETITEGEHLSDTDYKTLNLQKANLLTSMFNDYLNSEGYSVETYYDTSNFIKDYCRDFRELSGISLDDIEKTVFLGFNESNTDYYHFKEKLTLELFTNTVKRQGENDEYVIASPVCYISEEDMENHNITFLKIGRDIREEELIGDNAIYNMEKAESHIFPVKARYYNHLCSIDIEEAIKNNFDGSHLNEGFEEKIIDKYGIDRVNYVLACNVLDNLDDGRFRNDTKEWAKTIPVDNADIISSSIRIDAHHEVLNGFILRVMKLNKKKEMERFEITNQFGDRTLVEPGINLYSVVDSINGKDMKNLAVELWSKTNFGLEPYAVLTKNFEEFIGQKNCAYVDLNNCPFATQLIDKGFAKDTGFTKESGYVSYPLWQFDEEWLKTVGGQNYQYYSKLFDDYMKEVEQEQKDLEEEKMPEKEETKKVWLKAQVPYEAVIQTREIHSFMKMPTNGEYAGYTYNLYNDRVKDSRRIVDLQSDGRELCLELVVGEHETIILKKEDDEIELTGQEFVNAVNDTYAKDYEYKRDKSEFITTSVPQEAMQGMYENASLFFMPTNSEKSGYSYYIPNTFIQEDSESEKGNILISLPPDFNVTIKNKKTEVEEKLSVNEFNEFCNNTTAKDYERNKQENTNTKAEPKSEAKAKTNDEQEKEVSWFHASTSNEAIISEYNNSQFMKMPATSEYAGYCYFLPTKLIKPNEEKETVAISLPETFEIKLKDNANNKEITISAEQFIDIIKDKTADDYKEIEKKFRFNKQDGKFTEEVAKQMQDCVPDEMKKRNNWIVVATTYDSEKDKTRKYLIDANNGKYAESDNPETWTSFSNAIKFALEKGADAIAYALDGKDGIACIDLDKCKDENGNLTPLASELLNNCGKTYIEHSVSGKGLHIFGKTSGMDVRTFSKDGDMEFYQKEHFITMTADGTGYAQLESFDKPEMKSIIERKCEKRTAWQGQCKGIEGLSIMSDREVVEKAMEGVNGETFKRLFNGEDLFNDHSRSDMSLMSRLAFYCNGDKEQMLRIFATSGLYRPEKSPDYYECTAIKCILGNSGRYGQSTYQAQPPKAKSGFNTK